MDTIKKKFLAMPIKKSMGWIFLTTFFCVCILIGTIIFQMNRIQNGILERKEFSVNAEDGAWEHEPFTRKEAAIYYGCYAAMAVLSAVCLLLGMAVSSRIFYRLKLREPLRELQNGMEKAARDDLDFSISYDSEDELGRLCRSMERMRRELCRSQERTWELLQQRRLLNASVAHDLRTPVTVLKGYLDYLKEDGCDKKVSDEDIRTAVCGMDEAVKRLERYAGCVQDIYRLENVKVQRQKESVDELVQELQRDISSLSADKKIVVSCSLSQTEIDLDKQLVFRVIENLVQNAVRYASEEVKVELRGEDGVKLERCGEDRFLLIRVRDDGKGFPPESLNRAADLFFTTENSGHFGIGLNICRILCEKLGGTLTLENQENGGACVTAAVKIFPAVRL